MPITLNPNIHSLVLKHNQFNSVDASISFYPSLEYLDISHNRIDQIQDRIFMAQNKLEKMDISYNNIRSLTQEAFLGLKNLKHLDMRNNLISEIVAKNFFVPLMSRSVISE